MVFFRSLSLLLCASAAVLSCVNGFSSVAPQRRLAASTGRFSKRASATPAVTMRKGRPSAKKTIGKKVGETKKAGSGESGPPLNWLEVAASESELPAEEGGSKAVTLPGGLVVMLQRRKARVYCLSSSCKKCKFPLLNSEFEEETQSIVCGVCGSKYSITTGAETGVQKKSGLAGMVGNVMSANTAGGPISAYQVRQAEDGKIYAAIGYKYE